MRVADIPDDMPTFQCLAKHYHFADAVASVKPMNEMVDLPVGEFEKLRSWVLTMIGEHGLHGQRGSDAQDVGYDSLSLVCNRNVDDDWRKATLGTEKLTMKQHYYATEETIAILGGKVKNSYYDSYGFNTLTPAGEVVAAHFNYQRTPIRSRISAIRANRKATTEFGFGWHKDETVFENLRVNIPITTAPEYMLQIETERRRPFAMSKTMIDVHLEPGSMYSWDTHLPHRVYSRSPGTADRINIVLGFSPWFDYDLKEDGWAPNKFFGKKHPIYMLLDGDVL